MLFHTLIILWILVLSIVRGMSQLNFGILLVRGFCGTTMGLFGIDIGVILSIGTGIGEDTIGINFLLCHPFMICYGT